MMTGKGLHQDMSGLNPVFIIPRKAQEEQPTLQDPSLGGVWKTRLLSRALRFSSVVLRYKNVPGKMSEDKDQEEEREELISKTELMWDKDTCDPA